MTNQTVVKKLFKLIAYGLILLLLLLVSLLLFIRSPWGQSIIVKEATEYVSTKTNTTVEIQRLFITFDGNLFLEKLYLDDVEGDTLIYAKSIEASVELIPLITSQHINVDFIEWDGLKANVERKAGSENFNFNFLIEAFSTVDSSEVSEATPPPSETESSEPLKLSIGTIHLSNFSIQYNDHFLGINTKLDLEDLLFNANEIDLEKLIFDVEELRLKGTEISYLQTKPFEEAEESTDSILPQFIVKHLSLDSVQVDYRSTADQLSSNINIFHFGLNSSDLNLNKRIIHLEEILLDSSSFELVTMPTESAANDTSQSKTEFQWPNWDVEIDNASFSNNNIDVRTSSKKDVYNEFNDEHFKLAELNLSLEQVSLKKEEFAASLQGLSFKERSNFQLNNLAFQLGVSPKDITLSDFRLSTPNNQIAGRALVEYTNLEELLKQNVSNFSIYFPQFSLNAKDAFYFVPGLRKDTLLQTFTQNNLVGTIKATGNSTDFQLEQLVANWGASTKLSLAANLKNYNDQDKLEFLLNDFRFSSRRRDLLTFVEEQEIGIQIPKTIQLSADASGNMTNIVGNVIAKIPEGELNVDGSYSNQKEVNFKGIVKAKKLEVGKLLQNPNLGIVSLSLEAEGQGSSIDSLQAKFKTDIQKLELFNYDYADLQLSGNLKNKQGEVEARFKDYNLNAELKSSFTLDSLNSKMKLKLNLIGADLNALGWSERKLKTGFDLEASFEGNENEFEVHTQLANDVTVFEQEPYSLGTITIDARNTPDFSMLKLTNDYFNVDFNSNSSYSQALKALENQLTYYFNENDSLNSQDSVKMDLRLTSREAPVLAEAIAPELEFDSIQLAVNYNQANHFLNANLSSDHLKYKESKIDSILFVAGSNEQNFTFNLSFAELSASPVKIPRTELKGEFKDQIALVDFKISNDVERLMHIKSEIKLTDDSVSYHINPDSLLLNRKDWEISKENNILLSNKTIQANNFSLTRNGQNLKIESRKEEKKDVFELLFNDFKLSTFTNFLNTDDSLATGIVNGNLVLENPLQEMGIISNLSVDKLRVMKIPLGELQFNSVSQKNEEYDLDLSLQGQAIDLTLDGDYTAQKTEGLLDFSLNLQRLELKEFERLTSDYLSDLKGSISAKIELNGTTQAPNYNGSVDFKSTGFVVNTLNSRFKLPDEGVTFDTSKVVLDDFLIQDSQNNAFHLDGDIFTTDLTNPSFDLTLKADQFQVLNSTAEDNEEFYGKVNLNTDLTINGDLTIPIIRGQLAINDNSTFTYVVPEDELDLVERDGVIVFVNKKNPDAILTREEENESSSEALKGYDLSANLRVGKEVDFKIIIDQRSGDNLKIQGNGDFQLGLEPNGRTTFAGKYEVSDGYYEASLYNIVNRRFEIANGSSIVWRGNPLDADMDIRAIYKVETQASSLMAAKTSGQGIAIENDFRKKLPFLVYLNFDGELLQPEISFQLDMPEASQGEMGGQVYARVKQLNTQESELHKQVFSLLVLNQFFPTTSNDGTSGGSADLARGNVNKVLEDQLNNFSNKYLGKTGFELDFGVGSYTENQEAGGQTKTQLDLNAQKKLFNDQLIVSVGSGVSIEENSGNNQATTPVVGNISLEYIFSEEGTWRVKGFRKNEFESVIEGQLIVTGISLIYQKEFNKFRELVEQIQKQNESQKKND